MKIHEYQAKAILRDYNVNTPKGEVAETPAQARAIAEKLGGVKPAPDAVRKAVAGALAKV